ncbi:MAG: hypothetical protein KJ914_02205 [Gammaproteobacteria bacterium]|nr:hypothetical protein [Gammaproteobacteria bacterium]MBU1725375.1 hypothetical protein [Gammaproteobacteria bacterium]MBU2006118.1 hypothetical protein [Gammaproteobacteria bacterium]
MVDNPVILLADAGPLITLAYADALDVLLLPGWTVQMVDMVLHEVTRNQTPTSQKIAAWLAQQQLPVRETRVYQRYTQALATGEIPRKANLGELAIQEVMTDFALLAKPPTGIFLFEDHKIARASFLLPEGCHKISTRAFLLFLEQKGWLASAAEVERKAVQAGRAFSRLRFPPV